jgi:hypothetical protein
MARRRKSANKIQRGLASLFLAQSKKAQVSPEIPKPENLIAFDARLAREAKEERERPIKAAQAANEKLLREIAETQAKTVARFYSQDLSRFAAAGIENAPVDEWGDYPERVGSRDKSAEAAGYRAFKAGLASNGCTLTETGWSRLGSYLEVLAQHRNINMADTRSWSIALERLHDLDVFQSGELQGYSGPVEPESEAIPATESLDEVFASTSGETREGEAKIRSAVSVEYYEREIGPIWRQWQASLYDNFNRLVLTESQKKAAYDFFVRNNLAFHVPSNYDRCRRGLVKMGVLSPDCLTPEEKVEQLLDRDLSDRNNRVEFVRQQNELQRQGLI